MSVDLSLDQQDSTHPEEFSLYSTNASSIQQIPELRAIKHAHNLTVIRIMHSLNLKSMQGIDRFYQVVELNLSSNAIEKIEGLDSLTELRVLNLSCNRIKKIDGLSGLHGLERLILASNRITSLQSLSQIYGEEYSLKYLDVKDNKLSSLAELKHLRGLPHLQEVSLTMESENNPIFKNAKEYIASLKALPNFRALQKIDGRTVRELLESAKENINQHANISDEDEEEEEEYKQFTKSQNAPPKKGKASTIDGLKVNKKFYSEKVGQKEKAGLKSKTLDKNIKPRERSESPEEDHNAEEFLERERNYQIQIKGLHEKLEALYKDQKELIHKYEMNEKLWTNRYSKLEEKMLELTQENRDLHVKSMKMRTNYESQNREIEELTRALSDIKSKKDKKEDLVDEQQKRISELLKENGEFNRELAIRLEEITNLKETLSSADARIHELKAVIRENEKNLTNLHTRALENNTINIHRSEELSRKYEDLEQQLENKTRELRRIADKNAELVGLVSEWERKHEDRVNEALRSEHGKIRTLETELKEKIEEMEKAHEKEIIKIEDKFKENMDILEDEFKKVLLENNDKFKHLKAAFEDKCKSEGELKQLLKVISSKNVEFEKIIEEQNDMLRKMKEEYISVLQEKESTSKNVEEKVSTMKSDMNSYQTKAEKLHAENEMLTKLNTDLEEQVREKSRDMMSYQRRITDLETGYESMKSEVEKWRARAIALEDKEDTQHKTHLQQIEDLKDTITTKNRMLEDKNATIKELKDQMLLVQEDVDYYKSIKNDTEALRNDYEKERQYSDKMKKKVDKASEHIAELKQAMANLEEELNASEEANKELKAQLEKKNQNLEIIEEEVQLLVGKQDGEMKEKETRIEELEQLLEECNNALVKKKETQRELEEHFTMKLEEFGRVVSFKDKEIRELKANLAENEEEMKYLVQEIERQRKQAKENIEKLNLLFK